MATIEINNWVAVILFIIFIIILIILIILLVQGLEATNKYFFIKELNLPQRYGPNSWVLITGASSGQGKEFALNFAERGFNVLLIGSPRTQSTINIINDKYPNIKTQFILKDFGKAFEDDFFNSIIEAIDELDISILINNVGHRTGWIGYENMPYKMIKETIATGTIIQARLSQLVLPKFLKRSPKSAIINITAQSMHPNFGFGIGLSNEISVPYLSVYEASNAFGFYHANSLQKEYGKIIDMLNITPGAVITENTQFLADTWFNIDAKQFVNNVMKMLGNVQGTTCAYWGHAISSYLINICPWNKEEILHETGKTIAENYMLHHQDKSYNI